MRFNGETEGDRHRRNREEKKGERKYTRLDIDESGGLENETRVERANAPSAAYKKITDEPTKNQCGISPSKRQNQSKAPRTMPKVERR